MRARSKGLPGVAGSTKRGSAHASKYARNAPKIEPGFSSASGGSNNPHARAPNPGSSHSSPHPPAAPWTGLQRSPLARRHALALATLLAIGAAALGVAVSQLYQDKPSPDRRDYGNTASREPVTTETPSVAGPNAVPLFDPAALADNTARLAGVNTLARQPAPANALTTQPAPTNTLARQPAPANALATQPVPANTLATQPAPTDTLAVQPATPPTPTSTPPRTVASVAKSLAPYAPPYGTHAETSHLAAATVRTPAMQRAMDGLQPGDSRMRGTQSSVSLEQARAATAALTQDAITPLSPTNAPPDALQPRVDYTQRAHSAAPEPGVGVGVPRPPVAAGMRVNDPIGPRIPPSAAEATAALTAKAAAVPPPPNPARVLAPTVLPAVPHPPATQSAAPVDEEPAASPDDQ